ncbi:MAG TPA: hypothetical protein VHN11_19650 [Xanthobacteraceae bacterium]|jgi:hypothetical protein|nr:hypothetical protein [Xanthobacteraceae bacterium]
MTDYYPLIARAVAGLEKNTGESRRALYERARTALVAQLRGMQPPLSESEITRERLGLEEAVRKVEAEAARRSRNEASAPRPSSRPIVPPEAPTRDSIRREILGRDDGLRDRVGYTTPRDSLPRDTSFRDQAARQPERGAEPSLRQSGMLPRRDSAAAPARPSEPRRPVPPPLVSPFDDEPTVPLRSRERPTPLVEEGLKGFRDVVAETETLGNAAAQAAKSVRQAYADVPINDPDLERIEPRVDQHSARGSARDDVMPRMPDPMPRAPEPKGRPAVMPRAAPPRGAISAAMSSSDERDSVPRPSRKGLIAAFLAVAAVIVVGLGVYWKRDLLKSAFSSVRAPAIQMQGEGGAARPKITDRVGQPAASANSNQSAGNNSQVAPVAQKVVLYEEDPVNPSGKQYVGFVVWRTEMVSPGPGLPPELAVRGDLEIPDRRITMSMSLRRNSDQSLPASHTIEVMFNLPADFPFGGIANVPGILMKQAEQTRGAPLAGLAVKVTSGFFLVGLSAVESDMQRNIELLKGREWFDIPMVYNNGRKAILAVEKGTPGNRAFEDAFVAWKK